MTPYNEILYHLDLSIMAYHLFAQTLIWPWDPFYEQMRNRGSDHHQSAMQVDCFRLLAEQSHELFSYICQHPRCDRPSRKGRLGRGLTWRRRYDMRRANHAALVDESVLLTILNKNYKKYI